MPDAKTEQLTKSEQSLLARLATNPTVVVREIKPREYRAATLLIKRGLAREISSFRIFSYNSRSRDPSDFRGGASRLEITEQGRSFVSTSNVAAS